MVHHFLKLNVNTYHKQQPPRIPLRYLAELFLIAVSFWSYTSFMKQISWGNNNNNNNNNINNINNNNNAMSANRNRLL